MKFSALIPIALGFFGAAATAQSCNTTVFIAYAVPATTLSTNMQMLTYDKGKIYIGDIKWNSNTSEILTLTWPNAAGYAAFLSYHSERLNDLTINPTNVTAATFWSGNTDPPTGYTRTGFEVDSDDYLTYGGESKWYACPDATWAKTYDLWYMGGDDAAAETPSDCISIKLKTVPYAVWWS
ncbi:hypothetical protein RUND412_008023 [Rhizina undulata]